MLFALKFRRIIRDCILYDGDGTLEEEKINFERIGYRKHWIYYELINPFQITRGIW